MATTPIEDLLYSGPGVHAVVQFAQDRHSIRLVICPWNFDHDRPSIWLEVCPWNEVEGSTEAVFDHARVTSVEVYADDADGLNMPWDIIGMDCHELDHERWEFCLHCFGIEYGFESRWPTVTKR